MKTTLSLVSVFASALMLSVVPALGQFSLDEIEASVGTLSDEMARVDALLGDADPNKRLAAMDMLIKSGNADYATRAKEMGLFSSDKQMQRRALAAVFDAAAPFRIDIPLTGVDEGKTRAREFIKTQGGTFRENDSIGSVLFYRDPYDAEKSCWPRQGRSECAIIPTGDHYILNGYYAFSGTLALNPDGTLSGTGLYYNKDSFDITVNLVE